MKSDIATAVQDCKPGLTVTHDVAPELAVAVPATPVATGQRTAILDSPGVTDEALREEGKT